MTKQTSITPERITQGVRDPDPSCDIFFIIAVQDCEEELLVPWEATSLIEEMSQFEDKILSGKIYNFPDDEFLVSAIRGIEYLLDEGDIQNTTLTVHVTLDSAPPDCKPYSYYIGQTKVFRLAPVRSWHRIEIPEQIPMPP